VAFGIYGFFYSSFRYINIVFEPEFKLPLFLFIYEFFAIILAGVIMLSAMVTGLFNLFRGENNSWILSSPFFALFPRVVSLKGLISSTWPLLVMFLPMVIAFNKTYHLGITSLLLIVLSVVALLLLLNALTLIFVVGVGYFYYVLSRKINSVVFSFRGLVGVLLLIVLLATTVVWNTVRSVDLVKLFKADNADAIINLANISSNFIYLPTHPFAMLIINLQNGDLASAINNFIFIVIMALVAVVVWIKISPLFYPMWQKFQEGSRRIDTKESAKMKHQMPYTFTGSTTMALFKKEALVSSRNFKGMIWFLFLMAIWVMEIATNSILGHNLRRYEPDITAQISILQTFQFIIAVYFISAFTLRFVFPSFSIEKKTAWILGSAPLNFKKIFFGKYFFYVVFFGATGLLMSYINILVIGTPLLYALYSILLFITITTFIVTLGLSLGAIFPNLETDDPEIISTSMSGLFFTAFSLIYGAIGAWVLYTTLATSSVLPLFTLIFITLLFIGILLLKVPKSTMRLEN
jgi:ABC-2 type transport system permease protein